MENLSKKSDTLPVDIEQAAQYLEALTGDRDTPVTWCLLQENGGKKNPVSLYGTLKEHGPRISALNSGNCGVFIAVNTVRAKARRTRDNVVALRALFVDSDTGPISKPALAPTFRVQSARGEHAYWALEADEPLAMFDTAQKQLAAFFESDPAVCDLPRLMRVPGFLHRKGEPFLVRFVPGDGQRHTIGEVLKAHPVPPEKLRAIKKTRTRVDAPAPVQTPAVLPDDLPSMQTRKSRAESYLRRMPPAVEGDGGDVQTFKATCVVVRDFAVDNFADAMDVLQAWNAGCSPPWEESDLAAKVRSALRNGQGAYGSKLALGQRPPAAATEAPAANGDEEPPHPAESEGEAREAQEFQADVDNEVTGRGGMHDAAEACELNDEALPQQEALDNVTELAAGGLEGFSGNEDRPYSLQLVTLLSQDPVSVLRPEVVATLERLQQEDPEEFTRCLFEIKASGAGIVNDVKKAVRNRHAQRKEAETKERADKDIFILDVLPVAKAVVGNDHRLPHGYKLEWNGVTKEFVKEREDGDTVVEIPVCDRPVVIRAALDKTDGSGTLLELAFRTRDTGNWVTVTTPRDVAMTPRLLNGLALHRFPVFGGNAGVLSEYLMRYETVNEKAIVRKKAAVQMGWQGENGKLGFLAGKRHIAPADYKGPPIQFAADSDGDTLLAESFRECGSSDDWFAAWNKIAKYPKVHLGVLASLAAPLLQLLRLDNFFVDYSGETSGGKTTTLQVAASVWGPPSDPKHSIMRSWNTTVAGMERAASTVTGLPLFIDESNEAQTQLERQALAKMIYQLANGRGRTRAMRTSGTQPLRHWSTVVLSSGEHPIVNATQDAGTRARILSLQDSPFGAVNKETSRDVEFLKHTVLHNHGHVGPAFVQWLVDHAEKVPDWVRRHRELARCYAVNSKVPKGVAERLGRHLALLDLVGELMVDAFGLVAYESPVGACVGAVMEGAQDADKPKEALLDLVSLVYATSARLFSEANHDPTQGVIGKRGVDCGGIPCLAITGEFVRETMAKLGHNVHRVTRAWLTRGYLVPGGDGKFRRNVRFSGVVRCVCVREDIIEQLLK